MSVPRKTHLAPQTFVRQPGWFAVLQRFEKAFPGGLPLNGHSPAFSETVRCIERASRVGLSVWIQGEAGTEKDCAAFAIHDTSPRRSRPFVPVRCGALASGRPSFAWVSRQMREAVGGTIFLQGVDELSLSLQWQLLSHLEARAADLRFVASSTEDLHRQACSGTFLRPLVEFLCCLAFVLPPLRERREDIVPLVRYLMKQRSPRRERLFSEELTSYLQDYSWPGNLSEMVRIVSRLVLLSDEETITLDDLRRYAPELIREEEALAAPDRLIGSRWSLADRLLEGDFKRFAGLHPGVVKAVTYLASHYQGPVSLDATARQSCLTASHLSSLIHKSLGYTFRDLLCALRVQRSKQLLASQPQLSITEVCFECGFGELSTFERCFKRLVGCRPREYRGRGPSADGHPAVNRRSASRSPSASRKSNL